MTILNEDVWINNQTTRHELSELEDCAIAIDATYFLFQLLDTPSAHEPLLPALGGLTGISAHIINSLDQWEKNRIVPLFVFDGQSIIGQEEVSMKKSLRAMDKINEAWGLYGQSHAELAVTSFGAGIGSFRIQTLFPAFQAILKRRNLRFLVPPYNTAAQLAYFELIDSDQCAGIMGPQELLVYPIKDTIIRSFDWETGTITAISKKKMMRTLGVGEGTFIDAMLMAGTSFLDPFPPLLDRSMYQTGYTVADAVNVLRTADKGVANACASFNDVLQAQDPNWLDKYRKARLATHHFIYIAESGEVRVNDYEHLTQDNHEYLGLQLPAELFHYLNTGLIGPRILNCITHGQDLVQPTLDGVVSEVYKDLVTSKIIPIKEQTLGLIIPRVHRGIGHKAVTMRVWFDPKFSYTFNHSSLQPPPSQKVGSWDVKESDIRAFFPADFAGPVSLEVLALANPTFVAKTTTKDKHIRGIDSAEMITSVAIWRFLHLRGYVDDSHKLTTWGNALATTLLALRESMEDIDVPGLDSATLLAFELIKLGLLTGRSTEGYTGYPRKGNDEERASLALVSECASLLKLRHGTFGYTGPLNKSILQFRGLSTTVLEADRDLIEAIVASMFMFGQSKRERDDYLEISQRLPFSEEPDIGLGIAVRTFFEEDELEHTEEVRSARLHAFPGAYLPYAEAMVDDFYINRHFVNALDDGIQILDDSELSATSKAAWTSARAFLVARPF